MRALPSADRKRLESAVLAARRAAESACRAAIDGLGVFAAKRPDHLDADQAALRNGLRAKWRQLDEDRELLIAECAYEQWHRLAWKAGGRWRPFPVSNIACSGLPVSASVEEWKRLAVGDERIATALVRLHALFREADTLGSLIEPGRTVEHAQPTGRQRATEDADWHKLTLLLQAAASSEMNDSTTITLGEYAAELTQAAALLSRQYTLITTNIPFLSRGKQVPSLGEAFDNNTVVLVPNDAADLVALWAFTASADFAKLVREINSRPYVTTADLVMVPFEIDRFRQEADAAGAIPEPWSADPTQWLFEGSPQLSTEPLQVAVGRLLAYGWLGAKPDELEVFADNDGIVCLPAVAGEARAADRVQQLLAAAYGDAWSPAKLKELLAQSGSKKKSLADWLRDDFFKQHCALFHNRPFVWHVWDGRKDGFSALVNYHMLDRKNLAKLTYTYLGQDWVERQRADIKDEVAGAEARLVAALDLKRKLELILDGEQPHDIYVRWKEPHEQPMGWEPDLNDGVRLNVRPFVIAGVLRAPFNVHWRKDRGKNSDGSERHNDIHLSLADKAAARRRAGLT